VADVSTEGAGAPKVNRYFADESLAGREARALRRFARRDPKAWLYLGGWVLLLAVAHAVLVWARTDKAFSLGTVIAFIPGVVLFWGLWEWSIVRSVKRTVARQSRPGTLLTAAFGPTSARLATPDIQYEIPYSSITHLRQFGDVLVIKPNNHLILALPMELVTPADLALIQSQVHNRPMREASLS
jgi:hypothetical protein